MSIFLLNEETKISVSQMWTFLFSFYVNSYLYVTCRSITSELGPNNVLESSRGGNLPGPLTGRVINQEKAGRASGGGVEKGIS